jgi:hypothetical protein
MKVEGVEMKSPTYTKKQIIAKAVAELRNALESTLKDGLEYGGIYFQNLERYQSMYYRGEIEIFTPDTLGNVSILRDILEDDVKPED